MWRGARSVLLAVLLAAVASSSLAAGGSLLSSWYLVPAAASNPGQLGTYWRLDLSVLNPYSSRSITVRIRFLREKTDNTGATYKDFLINAGGQLFIADVVGSQFGVTGKGALELKSTDSAVFGVNARSYTTSPTGTYGHEVPGQSGVLYGGERAFTPGIRVDSEYRTNIGAANRSSVSTSILADVLDANGSVRGSYTFNLLPWSTEQVGVSTFAGNFGTGSVRWTCLSSTSSSARWVAYATPVDNASGDAIYLEERREPTDMYARPLYKLSGRWQGTLSVVGFGTEQVVVGMWQYGALVFADIFNAATGCYEASLNGTEDQGTITFDGMSYLLDFYGTSMSGTANVTSSTSIIGTYSGGPYGNGGSFALSKVSSSFPAPTSVSEEESMILDRHGRPVPGRDPMER